MDGNQIPKMAKLKLGVNKVYPIVRIWWESQQVTLAEKLNSWNTVSFKDVEFISACDKIDQEIMGYNFEDLTLMAQRMREFGIAEEDLKKVVDSFEYAFKLVHEKMREESKKQIKLVMSEMAEGKMFEPPLGAKTIKIQPIELKDNIKKWDTRPAPLVGRCITCGHRGRCEIEGIGGPASDWYCADYIPEENGI